ncbi:glycoside hydrolase family 3 N-terminal domain-containing protein [Xylanimonas sp. McL0601]|uniref:glycoside hydrolase family 3 N-terminal domain-containing protein n=1 Tax=Xylanimonas sp. McL0601 TaxID=3414739 RepID=UPI003CE7ABB4
MTAGRPRRTATAAAVALALAGLVSGCVAPAPPSPSSARPATTLHVVPAAAAVDPLAGWTLTQKVGQLLMVGLHVAGSRTADVSAILHQRVGGLFLSGRTTAGVVRVRNLVNAYRALANKNERVPVLVATDQEGGYVQVLRGPGFSTIPPATKQVSLPNLTGSATTWGRQLVAAGVDVNLAPVADLVPRSLASANLPIGYYLRNYGFGTTQVVGGASAFATGMRRAGVVPTLKHFPGLGQVTKNTDTSSHVTDTVTTSTSASVGVFRDVLTRTSAGTAPKPWVMMSTAIYTKIDPNRPAAFSPTVVGVLRQKLGFHGVIITDDLSAAAQVKAWSPGTRAVMAINAGCDVVLASADPSVAPAMANALMARARADKTFAAKVDAAVRLVLAAKA